MGEREQGQCPDLEALPLCVAASGLHLTEHKGLRQPLIPSFIEQEKQSRDATAASSGAVDSRTWTRIIWSLRFLPRVRFHGVVAVPHGFRAGRPRAKWGFRGRTPIPAQSER